MSASSRTLPDGGADGALVPPTDLELMMLADGELDDARRLQIEAFLAGPSPRGAGGEADADPVAAARGKIAGLRTLSAVLGATGAWPERAGIDVVDGVFAALDRQSGAPAVGAARVGKAGPVIQMAPESRATVERSTMDGAAASGRRGSGTAARPANDNGRTIFGLALAAAAAAAGLFVWGRSGTDESPPHVSATRATTAIVSDAPSPSIVPSGSGHGHDPHAPLAQAGAAVADARYGVEVASVDFGQRSGAIYYVPAPSPKDAGSLRGIDDAAAAAVTTVVWLSDE